MSFLAIDRADLSTGDAAAGYRIYFSPLPTEDNYPTIWLDLHVGADYYQDCEDELARREFNAPDETGRRWVRIGPRMGVRLYTEERIGVDRNHTAVVTNTASTAKHGLIVAPGKIDPGFNPHRLVLVAFNQANRPYTLHVGDKIACIAFAETSAPCMPTASVGHVDGRLTGFDATKWNRFMRWVRTQDYLRLLGDILRMAIASALTLLVAWITYQYGIK